MAQYPSKRYLYSGSKVQVEPATALHEAAVNLFDTGDGHGADWAAASEASFRCAFAFLRSIPEGDARAVTIARRALDAATSLVAGSEDSGLAYTAAGNKPPRPAFTMADPALERDLSR